MDRKGLILTVVGALLVIAIIVIAVVLMQRSGGDVYGDNYSAAMEHYIAGEYTKPSTRQSWPTRRTPRKRPR